MIATVTADRRLRFPFVPLPGAPAVTDAVAAMRDIACAPDAPRSVNLADPALGASISAAAAILDRELRGAPAADAGGVDIPLPGAATTGLTGTSFDTGMSFDAATAMLISGDAIPVLMSKFRFTYAPAYVNAARAWHIGTADILLPPLVAMVLGYAAEDIFVDYTCAVPHTVVSAFEAPFDVSKTLALGDAKDPRLGFLSPASQTERRACTKFAFAAYGGAVLCDAVTRLNVTANGIPFTQSPDDMAVSLAVDKIQMGEPIPSVPIHTITFEAPNRDRVAKTFAEFGREDSALWAHRIDVLAFELSFDDRATRLVMLAYYRAT